MRIILTLFSIYITGASFAQPIKNLVLEGGGVRGIAYAGALMELEGMHKLDSLERVAGTSAGAIAAVLYGLGYRGEEMSQIISTLDVKSFNDSRWFFIGGIRRLFKKYGWYRGEKFRKWMDELILDKTGNANLTFGELHLMAKKNKNLKDVYMTGTNLTLQRTEIFSYERYPDMELRTAVRASMGIPFYFQALVIDDKGMVIHNKKHMHEGNIIVDGGVMANFPIHVFDYTKYFMKNGDSTLAVNPQTIGMRLDSYEQIESDKEGDGLISMEITSFRSFANAFYSIIIENLNRQTLTQEDWARTISINTVDISAKIKQISQDEKTKLINSGKRGVEEYFNRK